MKRTGFMIAVAVGLALGLSSLTTGATPVQEPDYEPSAQDIIVVGLLGQRLDSLFGDISTDSELDRAEDFQDRIREISTDSSISGSLAYFLYQIDAILTGLIDVANILEIAGEDSGTNEQDTQDTDTEEDETEENDETEDEDEDEDEDEVELSASELPSSVTDYVSANYPGATIVEAELEDGEIEVELSNGLELEFDAQGNFLEEESADDEDEDEVELSASELPRSVTNYVSVNYPSATIVEAELEDGEIEVELDNDVELIFDESGNFLEIDD